MPHQLPRSKAALKRVWDHGSFQGLASRPIQQAIAKGAGFLNPDIVTMVPWRRLSGGARTQLLKGSKRLGGRLRKFGSFWNKTKSEKRFDLIPVRMSRQVAGRLCKKCWQEFSLAVKLQILAGNEPG